MRGEVSALIIKVGVVEDKVVDRLYLKAIAILGRGGIGDLALEEEGVNSGLAYAELYNNRANIFREFPIPRPYLF